MTPILGIVASSISGHLTPPVNYGAYDALASTTLSATTSTIVFAGIPQGYEHLQIRTSWFATVNDTYMNEYYNGISNNTYSRAALYGASSSGSAASFNQAQTTSATSADYANLTTFPSMRITDYYDYSSTWKIKNIRSFTGRSYSSSTGAVVLQATTWDSLSPITTITITTDSPMAIGSTISLYGVK